MEGEVGVAPPSKRRAGRPDDLRTSRWPPPEGREVTGRVMAAAGMIGATLEATGDGEGMSKAVGCGCSCCGRFVVIRRRTCVSPPPAAAAARRSVAALA